MLINAEICAHFKWLPFIVRAKLYESYLQARRNGRIKKSEFAENDIRILLHLKGCEKCRRRALLV